MKIVKIGAMWCPGCIIMQKVWNKLNENYELDITSLDLDMDSEEVEKYNVGNTLPVIIFYKDNEEYKRLVGEKSYEEVESVIKEINEKI
jgi:thiol-disulfide isomerase/thioredoxin